VEDESGVVRREVGYVPVSLPQVSICPDLSTNCSVCHWQVVGLRHDGVGVVDVVWMRS
jgi:hypothetical protein